MSKQQTRSRTGLSIGASSILVIFVLLCLVTFAVLSLVSARADKALGDKNTEHLKAYYAAETAAYRQLGEIDSILQDCAQTGALSDSDYLALCADRLAGEDWVVSTLPDGVYVSCTQPVTDTQSLMVTIEISPLSLHASGGKGFYRLLNFSVEGEGDWQPSDQLPVYGADSATGALPTL